MRLTLFDYDAWIEILQTLKKYKLRTALTAFGVFWGIFMLILLLGMGKGLENGVMRNFGGLAKNGVWVWAGVTSVAHKGMKPGRPIQMTIEDIADMKSSIPEIQSISPQMRFRGDYVVNYKERNEAFEVHGLFPEFRDIQAVNISEGRFINEIDIKEKRKVGVIGKDVSAVLFRGANPIGKYIQIKGVYFMVVGVVKARKIGMASDSENRRVYIPFTTMQQTFSIGNRVYLFGACAPANVSGYVLANQIKRFLSNRHKFDPNDKQAIGMDITEEEFKKFNGLFLAINTFMWIVGIGTLLAGMVGVSNIMMISVKERTREIGVRKALGAKPSAVVSVILQEALAITLLSGYFGMLAGVGFIQAVDYLQIDSEFFSKAEVNFPIAIASIGILAVSGLIAGYIPARQAAAINPIEALRYE